ncbi:glucose-1-phosphate adenylyltransferase subunit GlgD [Heyndrickxia sporothermodurans]|nr:glucose-1-phosphate adenylyltransferase subunit GlgD [Heyndrickxia sporothermodurans]
MNAILGIINLINEKPFLKELTKHRCLASVPFAGRYRLIDFTLSNYIYAEITQVAVFTNSKFRSIMDHLGSGKEWDLDRRNGGLFILPPVHPDKKMKGDIQAYYDHLEMFRRTPAEVVVISPGYHIGKIDYKEVILQHQNSMADITVIYKEYDGEPVEKPIYHTCSIREDGGLSDIELYTSPFFGENVLLETYVINKSLLIDLIEACFHNDEYDFLKDAIKANISRLDIKAYRFNGHMSFIHSIESYYSSNMEFLNPDIIRSYFYDHWDIYTKVKHEAPAKYSFTSKVSNSLIANGCEIHGIVENSIIFRGVKINKGAVVKNSIIMQKGEIEEDVHVENIIADKQVKIRKNNVMVGSDRPQVIKKSEMI